MLTRGTRRTCTLGRDAPATQSAVTKTGGLLWVLVVCNTGAPRRRRITFSLANRSAASREARVTWAAG